MGDRCGLVHRGAGGRRGGAVVVIALRLALCALVALGVACRGQTRDRATERAPAISVAAPADTEQPSLKIYAAEGQGMLSPASQSDKPTVTLTHTQNGAC